MSDVDDCLNPRGDRYVYVKPVPGESYITLLKDGVQYWQAWQDTPVCNGWYFVENLPFPVFLSKDSDDTDWNVAAAGIAQGALAGRKVARIMPPHPLKGAELSFSSEGAVEWKCSRHLPPGKILVAHHDGITWIATRSLIRFVRLEEYATHKDDWTDPPMCGMYVHEEPGKAVLVEFASSIYSQYVKTVKALTRDVMDKAAEIDALQHAMSKHQELGDGQ